MATNGNGKTNWNLAKDGVLWKSVVEHATKEVKEQASALVAQLQESVHPTDAIQGLLLDRIAAGFLRKNALLEVQGALAELSKLNAQKPDTSGTNKKLALVPLVHNHHLGALYSPNLLRYEALLDQTFHRDLMLLEKLKELAMMAALNGKDTKGISKILPGELPGQLV